MGCNILATCIVFVIIVGVVEIVVAGINYTEDRNTLPGDISDSPSAKRLRVPATALICASAAWSLLFGVIYCLFSRDGKSEAKRERKSYVFSPYLLTPFQSLIYH